MGFRIACIPPPKNDDDENASLYVVVDLSAGPNATNYPVRYTNMPPNLANDACRTTELWLRRIPKGTFIMGSPEDEVGRLLGAEETQHEVTLTQDYYMGVFECTQMQWELVMGNKPSYFNNVAYYATRPVESVSYDDIRGASATAGAGWPAYGHEVDATSFMGKLQAKTGLIFDLPTEAQWEYACRAGTTTAFNSGRNIEETATDSPMDELGRYGCENYEQDCTTDYGTAKVGSYKPNSWGLYDMHGNVCEWCLDWGDEYGTEPEEDPQGPISGTARIIRSGSLEWPANFCRSAFRTGSVPSFGLNSSFGFRIACMPKQSTPKQDLYVVVDLSGGPDAANYPVRYTDTAPDLNDDTCRTTELWLRWIPAGTFIMGSTEDELGRNDNETQHEVTLTQDYYIGIFECTQKQWELVMGDRPSCFNNATYYATRPVEEVSYNMIRGTGAQAGGDWPTYGYAVDATSFMGKLQEKTELTFDLPTEAQWEYACRAGTTTALNSGKNLTNTGQDAAMDEVGRYWYNGGSDNSQDCAPTYGTAKVGSYIPNAWGLYDMHGNVLEWTLDWYGTYGADDVENPLGPNTGSSRVRRGGSFNNGGGNCRSASRSYFYPSYASYTLGFRIVCLP